MDKLVKHFFYLSLITVLAIGCVAISGHMLEPQKQSQVINVIEGKWECIAATNSKIVCEKSSTIRD